MRTLIVGHDCEEKMVVANALSIFEGKKSDAAIAVFEIEEDKIDEDIINNIENPRKDVDINVSWIYVAKAWPVIVQCIDKFDKVITVENVESLKKEIPGLFEKES